MVVVTLNNPVIRRRAASAGPLLKLRSDEQLLALFRQGNEDAFGVIFDRYRARLLRYTRRMLGGNTAEAEDVLQDVFVRAYRSLSVDDRELPLKAWLYRVAHNRCIDQIRKPVVDEASVYELNRPTECDPHDQAERRENLRRLVRDVTQLPEQQRAALLLREFEGLSYNELAATLDVTVPTVKSLLVRARGGLLDSQAAENTACAEIRTDLAGSRARGVRMSGLARRHMLTCGECRRYHSDLRSYDRAVAAVDGGGPGTFAAVAKLFGFGSAGGAAATVGGGTAVGTGGLGVFTVASVKVVAVLASAAIVGGGALEVGTHVPSAAKTKHESQKIGETTAKAIKIAAPLGLVREFRKAAVGTAAKPVATKLRSAPRAHFVNPVAAVPKQSEPDAGDESAVSPELAATGGATAPSTLVDTQTDATPETLTQPTTTTTTTTTPSSTIPSSPDTSTPASTGTSSPPKPAVAAGSDTPAR